MRRLSDLGHQLLAGAEAAVEQPLRRQPVQGAPIGVQPLGLAHHGPIPTDAEPGQVLDDGGVELRPAAHRVDVLQPEQEPAAVPPRRVHRGQYGIGVAATRFAPSPTGLLHRGHGGHLGSARL